ncbi:transposase [Pseudomonas sp.]|uniref:transposase n=1 Tax=Pseudomonas sp. TaxID=306 RepID=UPI002D1B9D06|nr:transposase [Pseudomonas sp.]HUE94560.1 transposase [Pseudomonas sp.]
MDSEQVYIGIDVSKDELVISRLGITEVQRLVNRPVEIKRWLKALPAGCWIGMEATGIYHRALAEHTYVAGHRVYVLNPKHVAQYLKSLRQRGKTDLLDAQGIARFVANETDQCHPFVPPSAEQRSINSLLKRRSLLVKHRCALRQSVQDEPSLKKMTLPLLKVYRQTLAEIDAKLDALVLAEKRQLLLSIPGIGPLISIAVTNRLSQTPYCNSDAVVAAYGYDPRPRESGTYQGRRKLSKQGLSEDRRLMFMAARGARRAGLWKTECSQWLAKGLSKTAINCIISRKLLRVAFAVWRSNTPFDPAMIGKNTCAGT